MMCAAYDQDCSILFCHPMNAPCISVSNFSLQYWFFCLALSFPNGFRMFLHHCVTIFCRNCVSAVHLLSCLLVYIQMCFPYFIIGNFLCVLTVHYPYTQIKCLFFKYQTLFLPLCVCLAFVYLCG